MEASKTTYQWYRVEKGTYASFSVLNPDGTPKTDAQKIAAIQAGTAISGATKADYTTTSADIDFEIGCIVTYAGYEGPEWILTMDEVTQF